MKNIFAILVVIFGCFSSLNAIQQIPITQYQVFFSPKDHVADELISLINKEKKSIKAAVFCLMHRGITNALIEAHKRGVHVEVILDPFSVKARAPAKRLAAAHIPVYVWNPATVIKANGAKDKRHKPLMHDKFCIFGESLIWTGSFNFTFEGATRNQENVILLESEELAKKYLDEFERLKEEGSMPFEEFVILKLKKAS